MTLDEAILHAEEVAEEKLNNAVYIMAKMESDVALKNAKECKRYAEEYSQLAEWLKDYKRLKEQKPCEDTISRQMAIDALEKVAKLFPCRVSGKHDTYDSYNETWNDAIGRAEMEIEVLPSAQTEIIRCKDCKHWREGNAYSYCQKLFNCGVLDVYDYMRAEEDFCSLAERSGEAEEAKHDCPLQERKAVVIPENPTNGDVIKTLFHCLEKYEYEEPYTHGIALAGNDNRVTWFANEWWNSPYKAERIDEE